jgi:hypothetical protein
MKRAFLAVACVLWSSSAFAQRDAIDLSQAVVHNSPPDVATWAKTATINRLIMQPDGTANAGVAIDFTPRHAWPDYTPPGWSGPIQYTLWAGVRIAGVWHVSGIVRMWRDRAATGAPIMSYGPGCAVRNFACNWVYDARWGAMAGYQPVPGEAMVFFLTAGVARGVYTVTSVRERSNVVMVNVPANDTAVFTFPQSRSTAADFDGDGKSDPGVFRPSNGGWYTTRSSDGLVSGALWGLASDVPVPADFDGDGKADRAVFRPSTGAWHILFSRTHSSGSVVWGASIDTAVPGDYDGDGLSDVAVFRPSTGTWYVRFSASGQGTSLLWGGSGDIPIPGDYDGDGKTDPAVFRPSNVTFYVRFSTGGSTAIAWGLPTDEPVPADYDGDGRTDLGLFRRSTGTWYIGYANGTYAAFTWGGGSDIPVPADYDGDGRTDAAVFRPSNGTWYWLASSGGGTVQWGAPQDVPLQRR